MLAINLNLYSTTHCHLCEQAERLLLSLSIESYAIVEIADDDALLSKYGLVIPVLKRLDTNAELTWPFNAEQITQFLSD